MERAGEGRRQGLREGCDGDRALPRLARKVVPIKDSRLSLEGAIVCSLAVQQIALKKNTRLSCFGTVDCIIKEQQVVLC